MGRDTTSKKVMSRQSTRNYFFSSMKTKESNFDFYIISTKKKSPELISFQY